MNIVENGHLESKGDAFNCPNCGAPITAEKCEYCGTVFYDFFALDVGKISYMKIRYNDKIIACW